MSMLGDQVALVAVPVVLATRLGASDLEIAAVAATQWLPYTVLGIPVGRLLLRARLERVMVAADMLRAMLFAVITALYVSGRLTPLLLAPLLFGVGSGSLLFDVASTTVIPRVVSRPKITQANARLQTTATSIELMGPPLGGWLNAISASVGLGFNAFSFLASGLTLVGLRTEPTNESTSAPSRTEDHPWTDGMRQLVRRPVFRHMVWATAIGNIGSTALYVSTLVYLLNDRKVGDVIYGLVLAFGALGGVIGGLIVARLSCRIDRSSVALVGTMLDGPPLGFVALWSPSHLMAWISMAVFLGGLGRSLYNVTSQSVRQEALVDEPGAAQTHSAAKAITWGSVPLGSLLGGVLLTELRSAAIAMFVSAVVAALAAVPILVSRRHQDAVLLNWRR